MKRARLSLFLFLIIGLHLNTFGQGRFFNKEIDLDELIQRMFQQQSQDLDYEELYEMLYQLYLNPLNLNNASREELASLYILSELQINNFIKYREENGALKTIFELQAVPAFDYYTIDKLLPFVEVFETAEINFSKEFFNRIKKNSNTYFLLRGDHTLEKKRAYKEKKYLGSQDKLYSRFKSSIPNEYSIGFTLEKDGGESVKWLPKNKFYGSDFVSYHLFVANKGKIKSLILGDYSIQLGQGLVLGAGFKLGKGAEPVITAKRVGLGIKPYTAAGESNFFRGIGSTFRHRKIQLTTFYSYKWIDGSPKIDSLNRDEAISSINSSGYHRTLNEIKNRKNVNEQVWGGALEIKKWRNLQLGGVFTGTLYDHPLKEKPNSYNQFDFHGQSNWTGGLFFNYLYQNIHFFSEGAISKYGQGGLVGLVASLSEKVDYSALYRNYSKSFHSFYGNAFGQNIKNQNEKGFYQGINVRLNYKWRLSAFYDYSIFPWLKYQVDAPSYGHEALLRLAFTPNKALTIYMQYKEERKEANQKSEDFNIDFLEKRNQGNWLINLDYQVNNWIILKSRIQFSSFHQKSYSNGILIMNEIEGKGRRIEGVGRIAIFDTDNYDSRQYTFERDMLYTISIPSFYGKGVRFYWLMRYKINKKLSLWWKIARTSYFDRQTIGTGWEEIKGSTKTDFKVQLIYFL